MWKHICVSVNLTSAAFPLLHVGAFDVLGGAEVLLVSLLSLLGKVLGSALN